MHVSTVASRGWQKRAVSELLRRSGVVRLRRRTSGLVILMFHKVNDEPDPLPLTLRPHLFDQMLGEIRRHHPIVALEQGLRDLDDGRPGLQVALTFDDGYRDNYDQALPILQRHDAPATIFLSVDHINGTRVLWYERLNHALATAGSSSLDLTDVGLQEWSLASNQGRHQALVDLNEQVKRYPAERRDQLINLIRERAASAPERSGSPMLTWPLVREMTAAGISFGSHTMSHPILTRETPEAVRREVRESRAVIEAELGLPVRLFAYPNGTASSFNDEVARELELAGYICATTTVPGINRAQTSRYMLKRINVHDGMCTDSEGEFEPSIFWCKALGLF